MARRTARRAVRSANASWSTARGMASGDSEKFGGNWDVTWPDGGCRSRRLLIRTPRGKFISTARPLKATRSRSSIRATALLAVASLIPSTRKRPGFDPLDLEHTRWLRRDHGPDLVPALGSTLPQPRAGYPPEGLRRRSTTPMGSLMGRELEREGGKGERGKAKRGAEWRPFDCVAGPSVYHRFASAICPRLCAMDTHPRELNASRYFCADESAVVRVACIPDRAITRAFSRSSLSRIPLHASGKASTP